jgi:hypothetical protein
MAEEVNAVAGVLELPLTLLPIALAFTETPTPIPITSFDPCGQRPSGVGDAHLGDFELGVAGEICEFDLRGDLRYLVSAESDPPESDEESDCKGLFVFRERPPLNGEVNLDVEAEFEFEIEAEVELEVATVLVFTVSLRALEGEVKRALLSNTSSSSSSSSSSSLSSRRQVRGTVPVWSWISQW